MGGNRVADVDRRRELPLLAQEHRAGPGEVHRHERVEEPGREPALDDEPSEAGARREVGVEVQRVVVAGERGEGLDVVLRQGQRSTCGLADVRRSIGRLRFTEH